MENYKLEVLNQYIVGKRIVAVEKSKWSGVVRSLTNNEDFVTITLEDGTKLETRGVFVREDQSQEQALSQ